MEVSIQNILWPTVRLRHWRKLVIKSSSSNYYRQCYIDHLVVKANGCTILHNVVKPAILIRRPSRYDYLRQLTNSTKKRNLSQSTFEKDLFFSQNTMSDQPPNSASSRPIIKCSLKYYNSLLKQPEISTIKLGYKKLVRVVNKDTFRSMVSQEYHYDTFFHKRPCVGSLVELRDEHNGIVFGVVVKTQNGNFHDEASKFKVFTIWGEYKSGRACDVTFHLYKFLDIEQIFESNSPEEIELVKKVMVYLIKSSINLLKILDSRQFDSVAFAKLSRHNSVSSITIDDYINELPIFSQNMGMFEKPLTLLLQNHFNKVLIFFTTFLTLSSRPERYIMCLNKNNFVDSKEEQFSNYVPNVSFLSNSIYNAYQLSALMDLEDSFQQNIELFTQDVFNLLFHDINEDNRFYKWINGSIYLTEAENELYKTIVNMLKFYIIYPHEKLHNLIQVMVRQIMKLGLKNPNYNTKMLRFIFSAFDEDLNFLSPKAIFSFLKYFDIYKDNTDIFLSNNLLTSDMSQSNKHITSVAQLVVENANEDILFPGKQSFAKDSKFHDDCFSHLRYIQNNAAYGLPSASCGKGMSDMALSIINTDKRNLLVNIHIPDIGSSIHPGSNLLYNLLINGMDLDAPNGKLNYMAKSVTTNFAFHSNKKRGFNCITFSFAYDPWAQYQFDFDKIKFDIKLEYLTNVKVLEEDQLSAILDDRVELLLFFGGDRKHNGNLGISKHEKELLRSVYNICKKRMHSRNNDYALECEIVNKNNVPTVQAQDEIKYVVSQPVDGNSDFFITELKLLANEIASRYAIREKLPIYHYSQSLLQYPENPVDQESSADTREVVPDNYLLPAFEAYQFEHFSFGKVGSRVLPTSYFCGLTFLNKPQVSFDPFQELEQHLNKAIVTKSVAGEYSRVSEYNRLSHRKLGLKYGYVKVDSPFSELEQLINQWQLILSLNAKEMEASRFEQKKQFVPYASRIRQKGFPLKPFTGAQIEEVYRKYIKRRVIAIKEVQQRMRRFWMLKYLQQELEKNKSDSAVPIMFEFKCVVTQSAVYPNLADGYCVEMGLYVNIQLAENISELVVGDQIICSKIIELDPISGLLVLGI